MHPRHLGDMQNADGFAFMTDGCGTSVASGSMVTELAHGKSIKKAIQINQEEVLDALGSMPEESRHCALLAANTLKAAVRDYLVIQKEQWKRLTGSIENISSLNN